MPDRQVPLKIKEFKLIEMIREMNYGSITIKIQNRNIVLVEESKTHKLDD